MINTPIDEYYRNYQGAYLTKYIQQKSAADKRWNYIIGFIILCILLATLVFLQPSFAKSDTGGINVANQNDIIRNQKLFEINIKQKYRNSFISFPASGIAHIKQTKYINSKPIKINIVELNTNINHNLKIKPQIAGHKLNSKSTLRRIAQKDNAIVALNGGYFKPQTGVPLGALMIDEKVLTGPIYNRVGIAIFENNKKVSFKMDNIDFDIKAVTKNHIIKIDNINQPRMLQSYMLLYTDDWGKLSPTAPKTGYNMLIRNNVPVKISANAVEIQAGDVVLQGNKETISMLAQDGKINIDIKLQESLQGARHIISAGPFLVKNSQIYVDYKAQKLQAIAGKNPRSAIGFDNNGALILVTVDGREKKSVGMTLYELANLMKKLGCTYAMNFDGGSSSVMYVNGKITNSAVNKEGIAVSNALIVSEIDDPELQLAGL